MLCTCSSSDGNWGVQPPHIHGEHTRALPNAVACRGNGEARSFLNPFHCWENIQPVGHAKACEIICPGAAKQEPRVGFEIQYTYRGLSLKMMILCVAHK